MDKLFNSDNVFLATIAITTLLAGFRYFSESVKSKISGMEKDSIDQLKKKINDNLKKGEAEEDEKRIKGYINAIEERCQGLKEKLTKGTDYATYTVRIVFYSIVGLIINWTGRLFLSTYGLDILFQIQLTFAINLLAWGLVTTQIIVVQKILKFVCRVFRASQILKQIELQGEKLNDIVRAYAEKKDVESFSEKLNPVFEDPIFDKTPKYLEFFKRDILNLSQDSVYIFSYEKVWTVIISLMAFLFIFSSIYLYLKTVF